MRWFKGITVAAVATGGFILSGVVPVRMTPECVRAKAWVAAHASELPRTLDEFAKYSMTTRVYIFNALPYETRAALWHEQLRRFKESKPLNEKQRALVDEAIQSITPAMYRARVEGMTPDREQAHALHHLRFKERAMAAFDKTTLRVFGELGWVVAPSEPKASGFGIVPASMRFGDCTCNVQEDFCSLDCCASCNGGCEPLPTGCGWWGCDVCNGSCVPWPGDEPLRHDQ
jgi:hypothetical protein